MIIVWLTLFVCFLPIISAVLFSVEKCIITDLSIAFFETLAFQERYKSKNLKYIEKIIFILTNLDKL